MKNLLIDVTKSTLKETIIVGAIVIIIFIALGGN